MKYDELELILDSIKPENLSEPDRDLIEMFKWQFGKGYLITKGCCGVIKQIYERSANGRNCATNRNDCAT